MQPFLLKLNLMKTTLPIIAAFFCCWLSPFQSEAANAPDCPDNSCFNTQILSQETAGNCSTYTIQVENDGDCRYALSHFSIEVACGKITDVSNSGGWAMEVGTTDPTTGITGIKVDDIKNFGEENQPESFTLTYTVCNTGSCSPQELIPAKVAYKAATCVHYQNITPPYTPMNASLTGTNLLCAGENSGSIDLEISGGTTPYQFSWSNGAATEDLSNLSAGTYSVNITDASGESLAAEAVISEPAALALTAEITHLSCNTSANIQPQLSGGTAPYSYNWSNGSTDATLETTSAGSYSLTLTDANGCSLNKNFVIEDHTLQLSITGSSNCESSELQAGITGGSAPFSYQWSTGETTATIDFTEGGTYSVTVTDANGCSSTQSTTVSSPSPAISLEVAATQPLCNGDTNGSIDLTVTGGTAPYTYTWSNGGTSEDVENLGAGNYSVTVTDSNGCTASASVAINAPRSIYIRSLQTTNINCQGEGGSVSVEALFGIAPYSYQWSNGDTTATANELSAGSHTVVVTDANGCTSQRSFSISEETGPQASISSAGCGNTFELTANVSGGSAPYTYQWNNGEVTPSISAGPGDYSLTVTDANGCSHTAAYSLQESTSPLSLQASLTHVSCAGGSNGSARIQATGGAAPYTYDWSNGSSSELATNLSADVYSVQVTDANGCSEILAFTLTEPQPLSLTAIVENSSSCANAAEGSIEVSVTGGTAPYTYEWNTGANTASLSNLSSGSYTLTVEDAGGCVSIRSFTVGELPGGSAPLASMEACADTVICRGSTASLPVYFEGEGPFTLAYSINGAAQQVTTSANPYILEVSPEAKATYALLSVSNSCGEGTASGQATIQVSDCNKVTVCEESCFSTELLSSTTEGSCQTVTLRVNSDGDCRYALSHFNIAVGCGTVSNVSNSGNWPMEVNAYDPTTGLYGIKVDEIKDFGESNQPQSFTVTYTLCSEESSCLETSTACGPLVAYKAGTCVTYDKASPATVTPDLPGDGWGEISRVATTPDPDFTIYPNPYQRNQELHISLQNLTKEENASLLISNLTGIEIYKGEHTVSNEHNLISLPLNHIPGGTYLVRLQINEHVITKQLYIL
jgi:hypothetical protein